MQELRFKQRNLWFKEINNQDKTNEINNDKIKKIFWNSQEQNELTEQLPTETKEYLEPIVLKKHNSQEETEKIKKGFKLFMKKKQGTQNDNEIKEVKSITITDNKPFEFGEYQNSLLFLQRLANKGKGKTMKRHKKIGNLTDYVRVNKKLICKEPVEQKGNKTKRVTFN